MGIEVNTPVCYVVGAGEMADSALLPLDPKEYDLVIAADGGVKVVSERNITPNLVIGDFDSLGYCPEELHPIVLPCEKDDTDMLSAVRQGLKRGYSTFILYGGMGGREDHTIANIQVLYYLASLGKIGYLVGRNNILTAIHNRGIRFTGMSGYLSVFCAGEKAQDVSISGCKYQLENGTLTNLFPIGTSNEFTAADAEISVGDGTLLLVTENRV